MQVVILCGGTGTRLREETEFKPKPMIQIGGKPMIWHIMKIYSEYGFNEFILALGYKQEMIKNYFYHYDLIHNDIKIKSPRSISYLGRESGFDLTMVDTGENTLKGGRIKRIEKYINYDAFLCTYGDAVADINIDDLVNFHVRHGKIATVTGIHPVSKFGEMKCYESGLVLEYSEKPQDDGCLTNGGFFVFNREIFDYLDLDGDLEIGPLEQLARQGQLMAYQHTGYWGCMDTLKDMGELNDLWNNGDAPWKVWK